MASSAVEVEVGRIEADVPRKTAFFSAFAVFLGLSVVFGFLNTLREAPSGDFYAEWMALVFFCLAALFLLPALPRKFAISPALLAGPALLAALLIVQLLLGRYSYVQDVAFWLGYLALFVLAMLLGQGIRAAGLVGEVTARIAWALIIAALLNSCAQVIQAARAESQFWPFVVTLTERSLCRLYGNIGQANQASTLAWLGIGSALYLKGVKRLPSMLAMPLLIVFLIGSALSASRMAWLFALVTVGLVAFLQAWPEAARRTRWLIAIMLIAGFAMASYGAGTVLAAIEGTCVSGAARLAVASETGTAIRLDLWRQAIEVWWTSPLIGVGAFNFLPTVYRIETLDIHRPLDMYAHNTALQILAEFGIIGAAGVAAVVMHWVRKLVKARRELGAADSIFLLWIGVIGTHAMLEFPLHYTYFLLLFGLTLGLLLQPASGATSRVRSTRLPLAVLTLLLLGGASFAYLDYLKFDRLFWLEDQRKAYSAMPTAEVRKVIEDAGKNVWLFRSRADHVLALGDPMTKDNLQAKLDAADRLLGHSPHPVLMARRVVLATLDGDRESARWHLNRLFGFFPSSAPEIEEQLRRFIANRPDELSALGPILDEELARRPKARW